MSSERSGPIAGVVLAAGNSTRMGRNKLLLELDGEPVIRRAVGRAIAAVVMLPDMPFVTTSMLETLMARYHESDAPLVISRYGDVNAPPMLHGRVLFPGFEGPGGEGCGKHIVRRHRDDAVVVEWNPAALTDLDVPEDYERVKAELTI